MGVGAAVVGTAGVDEPVDVGDVGPAVTGEGADAVEVAGVRAVAGAAAEADGLADDD